MRTLMNVCFVLCEYILYKGDDPDYEMTPSDDQVHSTNNLFTKNVTRLHDYWCHASSGIAIEDDTDAKLLRDKQMGYDVNQSHNVKGSVHEINNYTRPFMSKIDNNQKWDTIFGNGIISDTHNKYISNGNGNFIEWIIEINNMDKSGKASIIVGISSDLMGETNIDSFTSSKQHGFGFDNLGNIINGTDNKQKDNGSLKFGSHEVVHIILDYSNPNNWIFYAKVGDIEEEWYDHLSTSDQIITVFDKINPGSYRLAVSLFSSGDALIIERCNIHGTEQGEFYQELKSYSVGVDNNNDADQEDNDEEDKEEEEEENNDKDTEQKQTNNDQTQTEENKQQTTVTVTKSTEDEKEKAVNTDNNNNDASNTINDEEKVIEDKQTISSPGNNKLDTEDNDISMTAMEPSPTPNSVIIDKSPQPPQDFERLASVMVHDDPMDHSHSQISDTGTKDINIIAEDEEEDEFNDDNKEKDKYKSSEQTSKQDQIKIEQQLQTINELKKEIEGLTKENKDKQNKIESAAKREKDLNEKYKTMEMELNKIKQKATDFENKYNDLQQQSRPRQNSTDTAKISNLTQENERLSHELKLAHDRVKSLDSKKQEMQEKLNNAIESKMKLIISTSEEIDHYRKLIQQIAQNKLGCQLLSDFVDNNNNNNNQHKSHRNGRNGYY